MSIKWPYSPMAWQVTHNYKASGTASQFDLLYLYGFVSVRPVCNFLS